MHLRIALGLLAAVYCYAATPNGTVLIRGVRVFDGSRTLRANSVLVKNGVIAQVGNNLKREPGVAEVDGKGSTLIPGLIDSHVHSYVRPALQQELLFGVTTELDMMDPPSFSVPIRTAQATGKDNDITAIFTSGWAATYPSAHGNEGGSPRVPTITDPSQAEDFVRARIAEGSDYIKIIYAIGGPPTSITRETMAALIEAAHKFGKIAIVHATTYQAVEDAMNAGADALAHIFGDKSPEPGFAKELAAHNMFVIPTLTSIDSLREPNGASLAADPDLGPYLTPRAITNRGQTILAKYHLQLPGKLEFAEKAVQQLALTGVPILAGTDAPNPGTWFGASLHRELELLVQSGMKPDQALAAATSVPARIFHLNDRGRIAPGLRADLILVNGDPTHDILSTRKIKMIWKAGERIDREALKNTWNLPLN